MHSHAGPEARRCRSIGPAATMPDAAAPGATPRPRRRRGGVLALGAVGTEMIKTLEDRNFPISTLIPMDIPEMAGKKVRYRGGEVEVRAAGKGAFKDVDIALFSAGADASLVLAPIAASEGAIVVDNSSAWRMDPGVPLVVPEVNPDAVDAHKGIIANPNCSTIQMLVACKPLHDAYKIKRIVVSTYQAVSGGGGPAMRELAAQAGRGHTLYVPLVWAPPVVVGGGGPPVGLFDPTSGRMVGYMR